MRIFQILQVSYHHFHTEFHTGILALQLALYADCVSPHLTEPATAKPLFRPFLTAGTCKALPSPNSIAGTCLALPPSPGNAGLQWAPRDLQQQFASCRHRRCPGDSAEHILFVYMYLLRRGVVFITRPSTRRASQM